MATEAPRSVSFGLTVAELRKRRNDAIAHGTEDDQERLAVMMPIWLAHLRNLIEKKISETGPTPSQVVAFHRNLGDMCKPKGFPAVFGDLEFGLVKRKIEANASGFSVESTMSHSWNCDCTKKEGCEPCVVINWQW